MNNKTNIIGLSGYIGAGKDEVANIIQYLTSPCSDITQKTYRTYHQYIENRGRNPSLPDSWYISEWENRKFAYKLKQMAALALDVPVEMFESSSFKQGVLPEEWFVKTLYSMRTIKDVDKENKYPHIPSVVTVRQFLQDIGNGMRESVHPNFWINALFQGYNYNNEDKWIISDVRYLNEVEAIKSREGKLIRIIRPPKTDLGPRRPDWHISETELDTFTGWDATITNNSSLEDLVEKVKSVLEHFNII